ncbi:PepSY domain-containing protein [Pseudoroseomonas globiformis]|uniref:PepSY domain-containing protein n=1 Tax=Teichococcus globiformis TaxID=2307229 RepID=A0ABV7G422_9PROT
MRLTAIATVIALAAAAGSVATAGAARADDLRCAPVERSQWMGIEQVISRAQQLGYTTEEVERDDGCWEVKARDRNGLRVKFKMHPTTGELVTRENSARR